MPGKLTITVGLPGSGKTTEAELIQMTEGFDKVELVSRDDLRHLLFRSSGILGNAQETYITKVQEDMVKRAVKRGKHVIVHDLNLRERYRKRWAEIARDCGAEFAIIDLTQVPLDLCVGRDGMRQARGDRYVGEQVIRDLAKKFKDTLKADRWKPYKLYPVEAFSEPVSYEKYVPDRSLPEAIIVDLDGTVALCEGVRSPYDYSKVRLDNPNLPVIRHIQDEAYKLDTKILFVSGRLARLGASDPVYYDTEEWLFEHAKVPIEILSMRDRDGVDDTIIKLEIFNRDIRDKYNVKYCLDDRNRVVKMWRSLGLLCFQVAEGDF